MSQAGFAVTAIAVIWLTFDARSKALIRIDYDAERGRWEDVLRTAARLSHYPIATRLQINRALSHTGRLTSDLFAFPQQSGLDLLPSLKAGLDVCTPLSDTLLELGQVNLAEHMAHEALEVRGGRPWLLERLALINILKDRPLAARVFLNRLAKVPFWHVRAGRLLEALDKDPALTARPDLAKVRESMVKSDIADHQFRTEDLLRQSVQANRRNRMAIEFLLANFLLTLQVDQVVQNVKLIEGLTMGRTDMPRHLEEAILIHQRIKGGRSVDLQGWQLRDDTVRRFERFQEIIDRNQGQTAGLDRILARGFGDTFWYYYLYGQTRGPRSLTRRTQP
jgi:hypothetical protein